MASMRVHELAKEFGMDSKVLLSRIQDMKIPAKSHASVLSDANVEEIKKALAPELGEKAAGLDAEAARIAKAEKEAAAKKSAPAAPPPPRRRRARRPSPRKSPRRHPSPRVFPALRAR